MPFPPASSLAAIALLEKIKVNIVNPLLGLMFGLALVFFLWGVFQFITKNDDPSKSEDGKKHMLWGIVGMFIMFSAFGIMNIICNTIGC